MTSFNILTGYFDSGLFSELWQKSEESKLLFCHESLNNITSGAITGLHLIEKNQWGGVNDNETAQVFSWRPTHPSQ